MDSTDEYGRSVAVDDELADLLARSAEGDTGAFLKFYDAVSGQVFALALARAWVRGLRGDDLRGAAEHESRRRLVEAWRASARHGASALSARAWVLSLEEAVGA